jgi:hypothetical protein
MIRCIGAPSPSRSVAALHGAFAAGRPLIYIQSPEGGSLMKPRKEFDCVKMKEQLHARLDRKYRALTDEQIRERMHHELSTSNSPIAKLWRAALSRAESSSNAKNRRPVRRRRRTA